MSIRRRIVWILPLLCSAQTQLPVQPQIVGRPIRDGQVTTILLAPRYATAIRMPEPINSVVLGDPTSFSAEHSDREPNLVFIKPITVKPAQTNLLISTTKGLQVSLLLVSRGDPVQPGVDFLMRYKPGGQFMIQQADLPSVVVPQTLSVSETPERAATPIATKADATALDNLLDRQRRSPLPVLYGRKPGISGPGKELVKTGVSEVIDQGKQVLVLFSVLNVQDRAVELMPPQIQLGGTRKTGWIFRRSRWSTAEQLPVMDFRMSRRRLGPGERADGVVVFQRPAFKQSNESLFLQMAESGAVDRPALAPIGFGISGLRKGEVANEARR